jgi:hypothetical protein
VVSAPDGTQQGLQISWTAPGGGSSNAYGGFGLPFGNPSCVDARQFTAVKFTVSGSLTGCTLAFGVLPSQDNAVANGPFGTCLEGARCVAPVFPLPISPGVIVVRFSEMAGGYPLATADPSALNGVQWVLLAAPGAGCQANLTITDVAFVGGDAVGSSDPVETCPLDLSRGCVVEGSRCSYLSPVSPSACVLYRCRTGYWENDGPCPP